METVNAVAPLATLETVVAVGKMLNTLSVAAARLIVAINGLIDGVLAVSSPLPPIVPFSVARHREECQG